MKNQNNFAIPAQALELAHFPPDDPFAIHCGENTLVVTPECMTAMEVVNTVNVLTEVTADFIETIQSACGSCEDYMKQGGCPGKLDQLLMDGTEVWHG